MGQMKAVCQPLIIKTLNKALYLKPSQRLALLTAHLFLVLTSLQIQFTNLKDLMFLVNDPEVVEYRKGDKET